MTSSLRARAAIGLAALLLAGLLAGCDEEDPADAAPSSDSPSAPQSSAPSEPASTATGRVEPTMPAEAEDQTKAGAEAFVEYYWKVVNYARQTGDVRLLSTLSVSSCAGCNGGIKSIREVYKRGGRIIGGRFELIRSIPTRTPSGAWNMSTTVKVGRSRTVGAGDLNQSVRAGKIDFLFGLEHERDSWLINFLDTP